MCGRFSRSTPTPVLIEQFELLAAPDLPPRYNIAPTQDVAVVRGAPERELVLLRWGLVPSWADDPTIGNRLINARSETAASKPSFRSAFRQRRCLVLADGFFEWQSVAGKKQPLYFCLRDGVPFAFAGLWDRWEGEDRTIQSFTILTTSANDLVRPTHDRMPVILDRKDYASWLDPHVQESQHLHELLRPYPCEQMTSYPVSPRVNSPRYDDASCVAPLPSLF